MRNSLLPFCLGSLVTLCLVAITTALYSDSGNTQAVLAKNFDTSYRLHAMMLDNRIEIAKIMDIGELSEQQLRELATRWETDKQILVVLLEEQMRTNEKLPPAFQVLTEDLSPSLKSWRK